MKKILMILCLLVFSASGAYAKPVITTNHSLPSTGHDNPPHAVSYAPSIQPNHTLPQPPIQPAPSMYDNHKAKHRHHFIVRPVVYGSLGGFWTRPGGSLLQINIL